MEKSNGKEKKETLTVSIWTFRPSKRQNDCFEAVRPSKAVNKNDETRHHLEKQKSEIFRPLRVETNRVQRRDKTSVLEEDWVSLEERRRLPREEENKERGQDFHRKKEQQVERRWEKNGEADKKLSGGWSKK